MHKKIKSTLIIFLSILMMTTSIHALDKNLHLNLYAITDEVSSGDKANFVLELKTTGSRAKLKDIDIEVMLPKKYNLVNNIEVLSLFGVTPKIEGNLLKYHFSELKTGMNERKIIQLETKNGYEHNKDQINIAAKVLVEKQEYTHATAKTVINAAGSIEVAKALKEVEGKGKHDAPAKNDILIWDLKVSANKRSNGQMFFDEDKKVKVVDTLPKELIYISDSHQGHYDAATHSVTWYLDVPNYQAQDQEESQLFVENITLKTKTIDVKEELYLMSITNELHAEGKLIDGSTVKNSTSASVIMSDGRGVVPDVQGNFYYGGHRGPLNGNGQIAPNANKNPIPSVYDTGELGFIYQYFIQPGPGSIVEKDGKFYSFETNSFAHLGNILDNGYEHIEATYKPSKGLLLNEIVLRKPKLYYKVGLAAEEMPLLPKAKLIITTFADETHQVDIDFNEISTDRVRIFSKKEFGEKLKVKELILKFEPNEGQSFIDGRIGVVNMMGLYFNIENDFVGQIDNSVRTNYKVVNDPAIYSIRPTDSTSQYGNRQAIVLPKPEGTLPIAETKISLETQYAGVILPGENTLNVEFNNTKGSLDRITNDYELFLKIPQNVVLDIDKIKHEEDFEIKSAEVVKNDQDYHYYKVVVKGDADGLLPGEGIHLQIPAEVLDSGSSALELSVYGHSSTKDLLTPNYNGDAITNTVITPKDDEAILEGIISDALNFLKSENAYTLIKQEGIYTSKSVKGSLDKDYSDFAYTELGQNVDYQLEVKHNLDSVVKDMVLVDVLPSVNDLGITDNVARDSKFNLVLTQEIQLNEQMQDKFEVYYSTAKNPKRDVLNQVASNTIENPTDAQEPHWTLGKDVTDFSKINSFMIKLKKGSVFQSQASLEINFTMQAPDSLAHEYISISKDDKYNEEKAAWNSFAVAINGLQVVEPSRVGVIVVDEDLEIKEPKIDKFINKEANYLKEDVVEENEDIIFDIIVTMPESVNAYQSLTITDQLNERFTLKAVRFNGEERSLSSVYNEGVISYTLDRDQLHALEKEGIKELNLSLTVSLNDIAMDQFGNVLPVENTAQLKVNHEYEYDVEKPTIVIPKIDYGELTVAITEGPNEIIERNTVNEYGEKRLIGSNAKVTSHPDNPYDISLDFTTKNDNEIIKLPAGLYIIQQDKVLDHYQITQESLVVEVSNGNLTVVEIINPKIPTPAAFVAEKKVSIEDDKEAAEPGDYLSYTIEIANTGETKGKVSVVDSLEHLIEYIDLDRDSPLQITNYELQETYRLKDLMQGIEFELEGLQTIEFHFNLKLKDHFATDVSTLVNEAFVNDEPIEVEVKVKTPKIAIEKLVSDENQDGFAEAGEILTYTINVSNNGEAKAKNVLIKDDLSQLQDYMLPLTHATITSKGGIEVVDIADLQSGILRDIEADEVLTISFDMQVKGDVELEEGFEFINRAHANDEETDVKITYIKAIITAEKLVVDENENGVVEAGEILTYTIIIKNAGQKDAENVFVKDDLNMMIDYIETPDDNPLYLNGLLLEDKSLKDLIAGLNIDRINAHETVTISFEVKMKAELDQDLLALINIAQVNNEYPKVEIPIKPFDPTPLEPLDPKPTEPKDPSVPTPTEPEEPIVPKPSEPEEPTVPKPQEPEKPQPIMPEKPKEEDDNKSQFDSLPATGLSDTVSNMANGFILTGALTIVISLLKKRDEA